mmetsp:Transcript_22607/g.35364  ORF Transcript_22607/g.35364 Transcript_22607/m.35364 type:complete len:221 (+) Transcript_22607:7-669(+)
MRGPIPTTPQTQMTTNHLSHFLLCKELFPLLEAAAAKSGDARIVNHSSLARKSPPGPLEAKYLQKDMTVLGDDGVDPTVGGRWIRYHQTKLANCVFTYALKEKLAAKGSKVKALVACPGLANTELQTTTDKSGGLPGLIGVLAPYLMQSAEDGACPLISCMFNPESKSGDLWVPGNWWPGDLGEFYGKARTKSPEKDLSVPKDIEILWKCSGEAVGEWNL